MYCYNCIVYNKSMIRASVPKLSVYRLLGRALFRVSSGIIGAPTESGRGHQAVTRDTNFSEIGHREHGACGH